MTRDQLETFFCQRYKTSDWLATLHAILPRTEIFSQAPSIPVADSRAKSVSHLGNIRLADDRGLAILEVVINKSTDLVRNRVGLRNLVSRFIDQDKNHGVLAVFVSAQSSYRFTFAARESTFGDTGQVVLRETAPRRFTYVLGPNEPCRTAADRFARLADRGLDAGVNDVIDAFSVEKLNDEFFDKYKEHYKRFVNHALAGDLPQVVFGIPRKIPDAKESDRQLKLVRDFIKKLLGRIVFLHFLQRKGWLSCPADTIAWTGGEQAFLAHWFSRHNAKDRFHSQCLVPLFYEALNNRRKNNYFKPTQSRIPYLNGGLFEREPFAVEKLDFPDFFWSAPNDSGLLDFLGQYNFTIDENDPEDHEIGIDPEMLGHIFENLLEDNKDKGAFYTPKSIVQYMCQQSLIHYLQTHLGQHPEIERLVRFKDRGDDSDKQNWIRQNAQAIEKLLDDVKICDPAIGSGAFPIGLLQEIYWIKLTLDWTLNSAEDRAAIKRGIIQNSIYGVDIDAGAVEIARLRFWLALIVEEDAPHPLPNLDYKIMQGDSLLESFEGIDLSNLTGKKRQAVQLLSTEQTELGIKAISTELTVEFQEGKQAEITSLISGYFNQTDPEKKQQLHRRIDELVLGHIEYNLDLHEERVRAALDNARKELKRKQSAARDYQPNVKEAKRLAELETQIAEVDRKRIALAELQEKPERPFFLWHLYFQDAFMQGGFDIVIANPPFGAEIDEKNITTLRTIYTCLSNSFDSFIMFMQQATNLLQPRGCLALIIPSGWVSTPSSGKLRMHFKDNYRPRVFVSLPYDVFGEAYVDTNIVIATRHLTDQTWEAESDKTVPLVVFPIRHKIGGLHDFDVFQKVGDFGFWNNPSDNGFLVTASRDEAALVEKLRSHPKHFDDFVEVMRGIETFHPSTNLKIPHKRLALTGDIYRYKLHSGSPAHISYQPEIEAGKPWRFFSGPRLLLRQLLSRKLRLQATYVDSDFLTNQSVQSLLARDGYAHLLKPILAILNSKLISWFFCQTNMVARRDDFPKTIIKVTRALPLPNLLNPKSHVSLTSLSALVDQMLDATEKDAEGKAASIEGRIDTLVYQCYNLTAPEISLVENYSVPTGLKAIPDAKSILFHDILPNLSQSLIYFSHKSVLDCVEQVGLEISEGTLAVYLSEATASGLIHDAGRGWYSTLAEEFKLDTKPVAPLVRLLKKQFPLLDFHCWATAQINPYMHHLLGKSVIFVNTDAEAMEPVADFLRESGYDTQLNPRGPAGEKFAIREKTVVVRKRVLAAPTDSHFARIETLLVDLLLESHRLGLMDPDEFRDMARAVATNGRISLSALAAYAGERKQSVVDVFSEKWIN